MSVTLGAIVVWTAFAVWCLVGHDWLLLGLSLEQLALMLVRLPSDCIEDDENRATIARLDARIAELRAMLREP